MANEREEAVPRIMLPEQAGALRPLPELWPDELAGAQRKRIGEFSTWLAASQSVNPAPLCEEALLVTPEFRLLGPGNSVIACAVCHMRRCGCGARRAIDPECAVPRAIVELAAPSLALESGPFARLALRFLRVRAELLDVARESGAAVEAERATPTRSNGRRIFADFDSVHAALPHFAELLARVGTWAIVTDDKALDFVTRTALGRAEAALDAADYGGTRIAALLVDEHPQYKNASRPDARTASRIKTCGREFSRIVFIA